MSQVPGHQTQLPPLGPQGTEDSTATNAASHTRVKPVERGRDVPMAPTKWGTDEKLRKEKIQALEAGEHSTENGLAQSPLKRGLDFRIFPPHFMESGNCSVTKDVTSLL